MVPPGLAFGVCRAVCALDVTCVPMQGLRGSLLCPQTLGQLSRSSLAGQMGGLAPWSGGTALPTFSGVVL